MTVQANIETTTPTQEETHEEQRVPRDKQPLVHRISPSQLANIRRCLTDPIAASKAQNAKESRHKNSEGKKRSPIERKDSPMQISENVTSTPNGSHVQATPPSVPRAGEAEFEQAMQSIAAIPYKTIALKGLVWGAIAGTTGALCVLGVKKLVARFSANSADSDAGFPE